MQILIGGAPGTGSSVLVQILNRHPALLAGPETFLFIYPSLYEQFDEYKRYLWRPSKWKGLKSIGWFRLNGALLESDFYGWSKEGIKELTERYGRFPDFVSAFFQPALERNKALYWVEKSPSNALAFTHFLKNFEKGKVIHTIRDPYDNIASLIARGYSAFYATAAVLVNQAFALKTAGMDRVYSWKYETFATSPETALQELLHFLELPYQPALLQAASQGDKVEMKGWQQSEKGPVSAASIGRFEAMPRNVQDQIRLACAHVSIRDSYAALHDLPIQQIGDLCAAFQYPVRKDASGSRWFLQKRRYWDQFHRFVKFYPTAWGSYPVRII